MSQQINSSEAISFQREDSDHVEFVTRTEEKEDVQKETASDVEVKETEINVAVKETETNTAVKEMESNTAVKETETNTAVTETETNTAVKETEKKATAQETIAETKSVTDPGPEKPDEELKAPKLTSLEDVATLLNKYYKFLSKLEKYDNANTLYILKTISKLYWDHKSWRIPVAQALFDSQILVILKKILVYGNMIGVFKSDAIWFPIYYTLSIIWNFSDASESLVQKLIEMGFIKYYVANIGHEPYITNQSSKNVAYMLKSSLSTIQNCVRHVPSHSIYDEENLAEALKPFMTSETVMLKALSVMTVSNLITEDENSKLEDTGAIPFMVKCMTKSMASSKGRFHGFSSLELAEALVRMAVNDKNKIKLVEAGALPTLVQMMNSTDEENQLIAAKLIWTLSFDDNVKELIVKEPGCIDALKQLEVSSNSGVVGAAKGAQWKISGEEEHQKYRDDQDVAQKADSDKHIFISYQHDNKQMVHSINARLKADGHKVWIDIEQMGGSTLESMASAVENAKVVLVCASENYKLSPSCRTEAEYTFQLKKPIVPLMMQRYYKADGWLGMLMGAKMYVNFDGKFEFNFAYQMLLKELAPYLAASADPGNDVIDGAGIVATQAQFLGSALPTQPAPIEREPSAIKWNNEEVLDWMTTNEIDKLTEKLKQLFEKMNGKLLVRFCKLKKEAPEFFYHQLKEQYDLDMMSVLLLTDAMEKLV